MHENFQFVNTNNCSKQLIVEELARRLMLDLFVLTVRVLDICNLSVQCFEQCCEWHIVSSECLGGPLLYSNLPATNILRNDFKLSIVAHKKSDHSILYTSIRRIMHKTSTATTKSMFNITSATNMVEAFCQNNVMWIQS